MATVADVIFSNSILALSICEASESGIFVLLKSHREIVLAFIISSKDFRVSVMRCVWISDSSSMIFRSIELRSCILDVLLLFLVIILVIVSKISEDESSK